MTMSGHRLFPFLFNFIHFMWICSLFLVYTDRTSPNVNCQTSFQRRMHGMKLNEREAMTVTAPTLYQLGGLQIALS